MLQQRVTPHGRLTQVSCCVLAPRSVRALRRRESRVIARGLAANLGWGCAAGSATDTQVLSVSGPRYSPPEAGWTLAVPGMSRFIMPRSACMLTHVRWDTRVVVRRRRQCMPRAGKHRPLTPGGGKGSYWVHLRVGAKRPESRRGSRPPMCVQEVWYNNGDSRPGCRFGALLLHRSGR